MISARSKANNQVIVSGALMLSPSAMVSTYLDKFKVKNPQWRYWKRKINQDKYAGEEPMEWISAARRIPDGVPNGGGWMFPRACYNTFNESGRYSFKDERVCPETYPVRLVEKYRGKPFVMRPHQQGAIDAAVKARSGIIQAPCGGGKTTTAIGIIAKFNTPALVIVHTKRLATQWGRELKEKLRDFMDEEPDVHVVMGGKKLKHARIVVATVQTLSNLPWEVLYKWAQYFGLLIVDEAHRTPARMFSDTLLGISALLRFGFTATPERHDRTTDLLYWHFGKLIHKTVHKELHDAGITMPSKVEFISSPFVPPDLWAVITSKRDEVTSGDPYHKDEGMGTRRGLTEEDAKEYRDKLRRQGRWCKVVTDDSWTSMTLAMAKDPDRNAVIVEWLKKRVVEGKSVLVLTERTLHTIILAAMLNAAGVDAMPCHGKMPDKDQEEVLRRVRDNEVQVVIATTMADEGLDLPALGAGMLAMPTKSLGRVEQRAGRPARAADGKDEPIWGDVVDSPIEFVKMSRTRLKLYKQIGCKF
jgi:superfamily II DNA or RNA helicase